MTFISIKDGGAIHDLKNSNRNARVSVRSGRGTCGHHRAGSRYSARGRGADFGPRRRHRRVALVVHQTRGRPVGTRLRRDHQTLVLNNLRSRIYVEADGQLKTGRVTWPWPRCSARKHLVLPRHLARRDGLHHDARLPSEHLVRVGRRRTRACASVSPASPSMW